MGRPRSLAQVAREMSNEGQDLLDALYQIARDPTVPAADRIKAANSFLDRAHGKPVESVKLQAMHLVAQVERPAVDFAALPPEAHTAFQKLLSRIGAPALPPADSDVLDVPVEPDDQLLEPPVKRRKGKS